VPYLILLPLQLEQRIGFSDGHGSCENAWALVGCSFWCHSWPFDSAFIVFREQVGNVEKDDCKV